MTISNNHLTLNSFFWPLLLVSLLFIFLGCDNDNEIIEQDKDTQVFISHPGYDHHFSKSQLPISLKGNATAFNGDFSDKIEWTSDKDGFLGTGKEISVSLSPGKHIINAYANNGIVPGEYEIPITIDSDLKQMNYGPSNDIIVEVNDRDGAKFIVNRTKGVIVDTSKNLMWQRKPEFTRYSYAEALEYAANSKLGGFNDWRLPTIEELSDIHNFYYDGREAILQDEFVSFVGSFWTKTTVEGKKTTHNFIIKQIDVSGVSRDDFLSEKDFADRKSRIFVRLVRNNQ